MPLRPCLTAGCPNHATWRGRCQKCNGDNEQGINRAGKSVYRSSLWQHTRRKVLSVEPMCRRCRIEGIEKLAEEVHHQDGNPFNNELANLEPICKACHSSLTRREQYGGVA